MSQHDVKEKADKAKEVLNNPVFNKAFEDLIEGINSTIADLPMDDTNGRLAQTYLITAAAGFKQTLISYIDDWKILKDEQDQKERNKLDGM